ncbi:aminotransferase class IV family protein [Sulfurimonas sp.]|uniref:aminotransferase class IV family protein n=1 Tax=Sulfurimonas sp. TaxID=2022749 RepID=UPI002603CDAD|nr:aminotransferase class IV family protein [Sulfurimonas sp.]
MNKKLLETIKVEDGKIFNLPYHQLRLERALVKNVLRLDEILNPPKEQGVFRCRLVYDEESYAIDYYPYTKRSVETLKLVYDDTIVYDKKYLDRSTLEKLFAQKAIADDVLIVKNGFITDTTIANCAFLYKGEWLTPKEPLLMGTTRARLLDEGKIKEAQISVDDIIKFEGMALMNAMIDFDIIRYKKIEDIIC